MKKFALVLVVIILFLCCGCTHRYSFEYKSMPEKYDVTEKEFTVHFADISNEPCAVSPNNSYDSVNVVMHPNGFHQKNSGWFADDSEYADFHAIIKNYSLDYFNDKQVFEFLLPITTGKECYEITRITVDRRNITNIYIKLTEQETVKTDKTARVAIVEIDKYEANLVRYYIEQPAKNPTQSIRINQNGISLEMTLPEGWGYNKIENRSDRVGFDIGPQKYGSSGLWVYYNKNDINGLCGTGLKTGRMKIGKYNAYAICYDNDYPFTYVDIEVSGDYYGLSNVNASHWWAEYKDDLEMIFDSLKLGCDNPMAKDLSFKAQYVCADVGYTPELPYVRIISSKEDLAFYSKHFAVGGTVPEYTDAFFNDNQIVVCMLEDVAPKVEKVQHVNDISLEISLKSEGSDDRSMWHVFVETPKINVADDEVKILLNGKQKSTNIDAVYSKGNIGIKLSLKDGWTYDVIEQLDRCGLSFYPESDTSTGIRVVYLKEDFKEPVYDPPYLNPMVKEPVTVGVYSGKINKNKSDGAWSSINLDVLDGKIYIFNSGAIDFEKKYEKDALEIIETLEIFDDSITKEEAVKAAKDASVINFTEESANYDKESGVWVVTLKNSETTETYKVDKNGYTAVTTPSKEE